MLKLTKYDVKLRKSPFSHLYSSTEEMAGRKHYPRIWDDMEMELWSHIIRVVMIKIVSHVYDKINKE